MRPWLHIPAAIFALSLLLAVWVGFRDVPLDRQSASSGPDSPLAKLPPPGPQGVLSGVLLGSDGKPVPGADLSTQQDGRVLWAHTDDQGAFEMLGLHPGPLQLAVLPPSNLPEILSVQGPAQDVRLILGATEPKMGLPSDPPEIPKLGSSAWMGRIKNPERPNQLQGYQVWLVPNGSPQRLTSGIPRRTETDASGSFRIDDLLHAPYGVHILPPGNGGILQPNLLVPLGSQAPTLNHGAQATPVEWVLQSGELFGTLQDESGPVRSAMVMLQALADPDGESGQSQVLAPVQTDALGRWSVPDLPPAKYQIQVRGGGLTLEMEVELRANQRLRVEFP